MCKGLCARAIVPVAISITGFVVVCCILLYTGIKSDMTEEALRHAGDLADTIVKSTRYAMLKADREMLQNMIDNIGTQDGVELVRIYNRDGVIMFSKTPAEVKQPLGSAGIRELDLDRQARQVRHFVDTDRIPVLAISTPIFNEPQCSTATCHFHQVDAKPLGYLDVGLDQSPLEKTLAVLSSRMLIFSLMVLMLTVGGVAALLRRSVFLPMSRLLEFTEQAVLNDTPAPFPEVGGEIGQLAGNYQRLLEQRDTARQQLVQTGVSGRSNNRTLAMKR